MDRSPCRIHPVTQARAPTHMTDLSPAPDTLTSPDAPGGTPRRRTRRERRRRRRQWGGGILTVIVIAGAAIGGYYAAADPVQVNASDDPASEPVNPAVPEGLIGIESAEPKGPPTEIDNRVFVVGDSVMQAAASYLPEEMPTWSLTVDTKVGRFTDQGIDVTEKWIDRKALGEIAVVGLGNNYNGDEVAFGESIDEMMTTLVGVDHVIWFNVAEYREEQIEVNEALESARERYPNLVVVDWNTWYEAEPDFTGADDLHLTPDGAQAMASLLAYAVHDVTEAANEVPKAGVKDPVMTTKGTMPAGSGPKSKSSGSSSSGSSSSKKSTSSKPKSNQATPTTVAAPPPTTQTQTQTQTSEAPSASTPAPTPSTPPSVAPTPTTPAPATP